MAAAGNTVTVTGTSSTRRSVRVAVLVIAESGVAGSAGQWLQRMQRGQVPQRQGSGLKRAAGPGPR